MKRHKWSKSLVRSIPFSVVGGGFGSAFFVFLSVFALGFSLYAPETLSSLRIFTAERFAPVLDTVNKPMRKGAAFVRDVSGLAQLQAENTKLRQENLRLRDWYQTAMTLDAENQSLRSLMNLKADTSSAYITTRVLADSGYAFAKSLLVKAGADDGVEKGQAVVSGDGVIGRTVDVGRNVSRILLVNDINSRVPVIIEGTDQHAILAGRNDYPPVLEHVPPGHELTEGRRIVTSGQGGVFPHNLPVGRIRIDESGAPHVELFSDVGRLVHVRIIDKPGDVNLIRGEAL